MNHVRSTGMAVEEPTHHLILTVQCGDIERQDPVVVRAVRLGVAAEEQVRLRLLAEPRGNEERGDPVICRMVLLGAAF